MTRAPCIRCCLWALFAVLAVFIVGGVAGYMTLAAAPIWGSTVADVRASPWSVSRPGSVSCCRSKLPDELSCGLTLHRSRGAFTVASLEILTPQPAG
jgi:hypothetical protein